MKDSKLNSITVTVRNGKRKIIVTHTVSGIDKRKEAADFVLRNIR